MSQDDHITEITEAEIAPFRARVAKLEQQNLELLAAIEVKDRFIKKVAEQTPEKPDYWSSCGQCERNSSEAEELLEQSLNDLLTKRDQWRDAALLRKAEQEMTNGLSELRHLSKARESGEWNPKLEVK